MLDRWLASPGFLLTTLAAPVAIVLLIYASMRRRRGLMLLGQGSLFLQGILLRPRVRQWKNVCVVTSLLLLGIACSGPQWGQDKAASQRTGRDVILVLDLSRSMRAEQPSRVELAVHALRDLADTFESEGGNRVALVLFAARAQLLFPLTHDYDHLRYVLKQIEVGDYPELSAENMVSGTRIGAGLKLAAEMCDPKSPRRPIAVLLSDGDDPADDDEWLTGAAEAIKHRLRVYAVGIGDPRAGHTIPVGKERLEFEGQSVRTRLNEDRLRQIADRTGGVYLPAHTTKLALGVYIQHFLDADMPPDHEDSDGGLPTSQQRYTWFLWPAVILLMLTMLLDERPASTRKGRWSFPMQHTFWQTTDKRHLGSTAKLPVVLVFCGAFLSISAAAVPPAESLLRQGNDAFDRQEYDAALEYYEHAERSSLDPSLLSFNKAVAYYRIGKFERAQESARRCLEDDQASPLRLCRAGFVLGNALLQIAGENPSLLEQAATAYRGCLQQADCPASLRADIRHNLELAQMLWLQSLARQQDPGANDKSSTPEKTRPDNKYDPNRGQKSPEDDDALIPVSAKNNSKDGSSAKSSLDQKSKTLKSGALQVLEDQDVVRPLSVEDTLSLLEREARRIGDLRRQQRRPQGPASTTTKDW